MAEEIHAITVRVSGRVQGVGFRDWTRRQATELGLTGWVRNETDGSVSALVVGPASAVSTMVECFWKGPGFAVVTDVKTQAATRVEIPTDFRIAR